jgi:NADPH2:quinone reductase
MKITQETTMNTPIKGLQLRSLVTAEGRLELSLLPVETPPPKDDEVIVRIEATPINPSDIGLLFGAADMASAQVGGDAAHPQLSANIPEALRPAMAGRVGQSLPVGNEGAGVVVAAGSSPAAQALMGRTVAIIGGAMYAQYRCIAAAQCLPLPSGTTAAEGAACFVNPLTALGMVETMRREGHSALAHTAAASNLGQMLNRICLKDGIGLVNIVRSAEQDKLLREQGAMWVCDSSRPSFRQDLVEALASTGATIAFDAIGGGRLAGQILGGMEAAALRKAKEYSRYGTNTPKQVYLYGALDTGPTELVRNFGMTWAMGGWLLFNFLQRIGAADAQKLRERVVAELKTTFASHYTRTISLAEVLSPEAIAVYGRRSTGSKVLINPNLGA